MADSIVVVEPISAPAYYVGAYVGSWIGGSAVGYVATKRGPGAVTGGLAASSIWSAAEGLRGFRSSHPAVTASLFGLSALSFYLAWKR